MEAPGQLPSLPNPKSGPVKANYNRPKLVLALTKPFLSLFFGSSN